jgi:hypothetical protein
MAVAFGFRPYPIRWTWFRADLLKNAANIGARTCAVTKDNAKALAAAQAAIPNYNAAITTITLPASCNPPPAALVSEVTVTVREPYRLIVSDLRKKIPINISPLTRTATYRLE